MLQIRDADHFTALLEENKPFVVWFSASWCGPCRTINKAELSALATELDLALYYCDVDSNGPVMGACRVKQVPTFLAIRDGKLGARMSGADIPAIHAFLRKIAALSN
jgi:thioredoxin 1